MPRYALDCVSHDGSHNKLIDASEGVVFFKVTEGEYHRICTAKLKSGEWSIWLRGEIAETGDHLEQLHSHALAHFMLAGSEGFPVQELLR